MIVMYYWGKVIDPLQPWSLNKQLANSCLTVNQRFGGHFG